MSEGIIDPVTSYTYNIELKVIKFMNWQMKLKPLGWTADATGYHLTINRANNCFKVLLTMQ